MEQAKDTKINRKQNKVTDSKDLLMLSLSKFYSIKNNVSKMLPLIEQRSDLSLRGFQIILFNLFYFLIIFLRGCLTQVFHLSATWQSMIPIHRGGFRIQHFHGHLT